MTKSPVIPSKLPELLNNYKKKNHLNNYEMVNEINNLINNNSDKILMKTDDYGETQPSSAFMSYTSNKVRARPKNLQQRIAIIDLLNVNYMDTLFSNGSEIVDFLKNVYNYNIQILEKINYEKDLFKGNHLLNRQAIKEIMAESKNTSYVLLASFMLSFLDFLSAFNLDISPINAVYGYMTPEELSKSVLIITLHEYLLNSKNKFTENDNFKILKTLIQSDTTVLESIIFDLKEYKDDFFSTFNIASYGSHPLNQDQFTDNFKYEQVYNLFQEKINGLLYIKNEKRAISNASNDLLVFLLDDLANQLSKSSYIKIYDKSTFNKIIKSMLSNKEDSN